MLKTREQRQEYCNFDNPHLENEINKEMLKDLGARTQGVKAMEEAVKNDLTKGKTKEKEEEDYERTSKGIY